MSACHLAFQDTVIECEDAQDRAIRWAVGSIDGSRGATWRLWGDKKGDVYVAARSITGLVKASFHRDRKCHLGFTCGYYIASLSRAILSRSARVSGGQGPGV